MQKPIRLRIIANFTSRLLDSMPFRERKVSRLFSSLQLTGADFFAIKFHGGVANRAIAIKPETMRVHRAIITREARSSLMAGVP